MRWWVEHLAYSPDGNTIASGGGWETIHIWDILTGKLITTIDGKTDSIYSIAFAPDGKTLASASGYDFIHLWDTASWELKNKFVGHENDVKSIAYSPDGNTLASVSLDGTMLLWDTSTSITTLSLVPTLGQHNAVGQQLHYSINIVNGQSIAGYQFTLLYDTSTLRYVDSRNGSYLDGGESAGVFVIPPIVSEKGVTLAATTLTGTSSGKGVLATVTLEVIAESDLDINLTNALLVQGTGKSHVPQIEDLK